MHGFKSGDYDRRINQFFIVMAVVLAVVFGVGLAITGLAKEIKLFD